MAHKQPNNNQSESEMLNRIIQLLEEQKMNAHPPVYDNKSLMALLGIKDKLLKKLRDSGMLAYSRIGDKYWYKQEYVDAFLASCHYKAFAAEMHSPQYAAL